MARIVQCVVLGTPAEGLDYAPYPGELGQRIYNEVSKEGWQRWVAHQTLHPGNGHQTFTARDFSYAMQTGGGIHHRIASRKFHQLLAKRCADRKLAAVVGRGVAQEMRDELVRVIPIGRMIGQQRTTILHLMRF